MSYKAFQVVDQSRTDADLGEVASTLIHEIHHKMGYWEYGAYTMQWQTFNALKVPLNSHLAINARGYLENAGYELTPEGTWQRPKVSGAIEWFTK